MDSSPHKSLIRTKWTTANERSCGVRTCAINATFRYFIEERRRWVQSSSVHCPLQLWRMSTRNHFYCHFKWSMFTCLLRSHFIRVSYEIEIGDANPFKSIFQLYFYFFHFIFQWNEIRAKFKPFSHVHYFENEKIDVNAFHVLILFPFTSTETLRMYHIFAFTLWSSLDTRRELIWTGHISIRWNIREVWRCRYIENPFMNRKICHSTVGYVARIWNINHDTGRRISINTTDRQPNPKLNEKKKWKLFDFDFFSSRIFSSTQFFMANLLL